MEGPRVLAGRGERGRAGWEGEHCVLAGVRGPPSRAGWERQMYIRDPVQWILGSAS